MKRRSRAETKMNTVEVFKSTDQKWYARVYDSYGMVVGKTHGHDRAIDAENSGIGLFTNLYPGEYCRVDRPRNLG
jgi:hypothetical protein